MLLKRSERGLLSRIGALAVVAAAVSAVGCSPSSTSPTASVAALGTPSLVGPVAGAFVTLRPTFVVNNATHTTPSGSVAYQFDVSTESSFGAIVASGSVPEGPGQTSFVPATDLAAATAYFWRVQAIDGLSHQTSPAVIGNFVTPVVGAVTLTVHNPTACNSITTDIVIKGSVDASVGGLSFLSAGGTSTHIQLVVPVGGQASVVGDDQGLGQGEVFPDRLFFPTMRIELRIGTSFDMTAPLRVAVPAPISAVSFGVPGEITGTFNGKIATWNVFGDGGETCTSSVFTWRITPR